MNPTRAILVVSVFVTSVLAASRSSATGPGTLDPTFGTNGLTIQNGTAVAEVRQPDGKIVTAGTRRRYEVALPGYVGDFEVARFTSDGAPDPSFGTGGGTTTSFGTLNDAQVKAVALQSDGMIVVAGVYTIDPHAPLGESALARYQSDGTLDPSFGSGGVATIASHLAACGIAVASDGKIVVAGNLPSDLAAVERFDAVGSPDPGFGSGGLATEASVNAAALVLQPDDEPVIAGATRTNPSDTVLVRWDTTGTLDPSFGSGGIAVHALGPSDDGALALALAGNEFLTTGLAYGVGAVVSRFAANGSLDPSFGTGGTTVFSDLVPHAVAASPDGKVVVAGGLRPEEQDYDFAVARFTATGAIDTPFGDGGTASTSVDPSLDDIPWSALVEPDGRIIAVGTLSDSSKVLARYTGSGCGPAFGAAQGQLKITRPGDPAKNRLLWKWSRSTAALALADFGDPVNAGPSLVLELFDATDPSTPIATTTIAAGGTCAGKAVLEGAPERSGVPFFRRRTRERYRERESPRRCRWQGRFVRPGEGTGAHAPSLPLTPPVTIRLRRADDEACWQSTFDADIRANDATTFTAKH